MAFRRATALAALAAASEASRTSRPRDGYTMYEDMPLLDVSVCKTSELTAIRQSLEVRECRVFEENQPADGECAEFGTVCRTLNDAHDLLQRYPEALKLVTDDTGRYMRRTSGVPQSFDSRSSAAADFYGAWRGHDAQASRVADLVAASGGVATLEIAGQSHEGRDIKIVRMRGAGYSPGSGKRIFLTFNLHAREWITGMAGVYTVEKLIEMVKNDPSLIAGTEVVVMPMANPDGMLYTESESRFHRKNTNGVENAGWFCTGGVDLNRNYDSHWATVGSSSNRCQDTFHGPGPNSEKETQVVVNVMKEAPMAVFIDVHSYTQLILASWGWTRADHPRKADFDSLGLKMQASIQGKHGQPHRYGAIAQILYQAAGGSNDYGTDQGALGYCFEMRPRRNQGLGGFAPPVSEILPASEEVFEGILDAVKYARDSR